MTSTRHMSFLPQKYMYLIQLTTTFAVVHKKNTKLYTPKEAFMCTRWHIIVEGVTCNFKFKSSWWHKYCTGNKCHPSHKWVQKQKTDDQQYLFHYVQGEGVLFLHVTSFFFIYSLSHFPTFILKLKKKLPLALLLWLLVDLELIFEGI